LKTIRGLLGVASRHHVRQPSASRLRVNRRVVVVSRNENENASVMVNGSVISLAECVSALAHETCCVTLTLTLNGILISEIVNEILIVMMTSLLSDFGYGYGSEICRVLLCHDPPSRECTMYPPRVT